MADCLLAMLQDNRVDLISVVISIVSCIVWVVTRYEYVACINQLLDCLGSAVVNHVLGQTAQVTGVFDQLVVLIFIYVVDQSILDVWRIDNYNSWWLIAVKSWSYFFTSNLFLIRCQAGNLRTCYSLQTLRISCIPLDFTSYRVLNARPLKGQSFGFRFRRIKTCWYFVDNSPLYILLLVDSFLAVLQDNSVDLINIIIRVVNRVSRVVTWYQNVASNDQLLDRIFSAVANRSRWCPSQVTGVFD